MTDFEKKMTDCFLRFTLNNSFKDYNFYTMFHRGSLREALKTRKKINISEFFKLLYSYNYTFYGFDDRINCYRYIISDLAYNFEFPTWLLVEVKNE